MHTLSMHNNMFDCTFNILCFFFGVLNKVYIMVGGGGLLTTILPFPLNNATLHIKNYSSYKQLKNTTSGKISIQLAATSNYLTQTVCMKT